MHPNDIQIPKQHQIQQLISNQNLPTPPPDSFSQHKRQTFMKIKQSLSPLASTWKRKYQKWDCHHQNLSSYRNERMLSFLFQSNWKRELSELQQQVNLKTELIQQIIIDAIRGTYYDPKQIQAFYRIIWQKLLQQLWNEFLCLKEPKLTNTIIQGDKAELVSYITGLMKEIQVNHAQQVNEPRFSSDQQQQDKNKNKTYQLGKNVYITNFQYNNYNVKQLLDDKYLQRFLQRFSQLPARWKERLTYNFQYIFQRQF